MLRDSKLDLRASIRILIELKFGGKFWGETHGCNISARRCCRRNHLRRRSICPGRRSFRSRIGTRMACKWNANKMYIILSNMDTILNPFFLTAAKVKKISISNANKFEAGDFSVYTREKYKILPFYVYIKRSCGRREKRAPADLVSKFL